MTLRVLISLLAASLAIAFVYYTNTDLEAVPDFYAKNIRGSLFAGFLTVGSFLLSLKTFIIVKLKENIFDSEAYRKNLEKQRKLDKNISLYGPLKRLSRIIFFSISSAIFASIIQLSIGLIQHWTATFLCIFFSVFAIGMLTATLLLIRKILDRWLDDLEDENKKEQKDAQNMSEQENAQTK